MKKLSLLVLSLLAFGFTFAAGTTTVSVSADAKIANPERVPPIPSTTAQYSFNESWVKNLITQKNTLLQVNCNGSAILQALGFGASTKKLFSLWLEENGYEYTFDIKNCSLRGNKVDVNYNYTKSLTEKEALASAEAFMTTAFLKDKVFYQLGKAFVLYKNSNGPIYPLMREWTTVKDDVTNIEIDPNDTADDIVPEYTSFTIMYPYVINGQEVWDQYGNKVGMTLDVSADGVMSINARLLPFKAAKRNSEKLSGDDAVRILQNWGNSPFYSQTSTPIKFKAPEKVLVLFNLRRDNKTYLYISSGIGLKSDVKVDQRAQQPYTMILSDYKIGNTAQ
jgi:hypothetical protein